MMCAKCGGALGSVARFCWLCGTPVTVATMPLVRQPPVEPSSRRALFLGSGGVLVAIGLGIHFLRSQPKRLIVNAQGGGDYRTIASAILDARPIDTIVVRPGTYLEALTIDRDLRIVGEGGHSKVIVESAPGASVFTFTKGSATLTGLAIRVVGTDPIDGEGITSGITVAGGTPLIEDCDLTSSAGSTVYIYGETSNPTLRNCTIRDGKQSGVYVYGRGQGTILNCLIYGNTHQGVHVRTGGNPVIRSCTIRDGKSSGVYVHEKGMGTIEKCVISGNTHPGVTIRTGGNPVIRDCAIRDGKASGVFVYEQGQGTIEKCVIAANANSGVQVRSGGNPVIRDCDIIDGKASGIFVYEQGQGTFTGNTLTGNALGAWDIASTAENVTRTGNNPNS